SYPVCAESIDTTRTEGLGTAKIDREMRTASSRMFVPLAGGVFELSWTTTVMLDGKLTFRIFDFAMVLFGTIARSRRVVNTCVALQFISITLPSVPPSILIQSPGRYGRLRLSTRPENTSFNVL